MPGGGGRAGFRGREAVEAREAQGQSRHGFPGVRTCKRLRQLGWHRPLALSLLIVRVMAQQAPAPRRWLATPEDAQLMPPAALESKPRPQLCFGLQLSGESHRGLSPLFARAAGRRRELCPRS